jgi:hypothetical protein
MRVSTHQLNERLEKCVRTWDPALARAFLRYVAARPRLPNRGGRGAAPYWLLLPQWLAGRVRGGRTAGAQFLSDALFGQCCAFLAVKVHDDVFDGHVDDRSLIFAADHLFISAREAFTPHFRGDSPFWRFYDNSVRRTLDAIVATDACQVRGYGSPASVRALAGEGYAVCNVATIAACLRARTPALFAKIVRCTDELAFVGQLLDDMEDVREDLGRGRRNYAAWFLLGRSGRNGDDAMQPLMKNLVINGAADAWFALLRRHLTKAAGHAASAGIPELAALVAEHQREIDAAEDLYHKQRVNLFFRGLTGRISAQKTLTRT